MSIVRLYEYIFYVHYKWSVKVDGKLSNLLLNACISMSGAIALYLWGFFMLTSAFFPDGGWLLRLSKPQTRVLIVVMMTSVLLFNYIFFKYKDRYKIILKKFDGRVDLKFINITVLSFAVGSLIFFSFSMSFGIYLNRLHGVY